MSKAISDKEKIDKLVEHYKNNGLLIVGLNDPQGVNIAPTFFKKGLLEYLASLLTTDELTPEVISAFSLTMNKVEHIDYFLKNNLTLEEIKLSQIYSVVSCLEKVMADMGLPRFIGRVGNIYRLIYNPQKGDEKIKITTSLQSAKEPMLIYSSGVNNLMREVGSNPFDIKAYYKARNIRTAYDYTLSKVKDPQTLKKVLEQMERNFNNILSVNGATDIYALGVYVLKSLQSDEMNIFRDLIISYNESLRQLCKQYGVTFVDISEIGKEYNKSQANFYISIKGQNALANCILDHMYQRKIVNSPNSYSNNLDGFEISNDGARGVLDSLFDDYSQSFGNSVGLSGYPRERELAIANEHHREAKVFRKVLEHKKK